MTQETRLRLLEAQVKDLRTKLPSSTPSPEALYRCWQAEREERVVAEMALREFGRAADGILVELEGLVWFLRGSPKPMEV